MLDDQKQICCIRAVRDSVSGFLEHSGWSVYISDHREQLCIRCGERPYHTAGVGRCFRIPAVSQKITAVLNKLSIVHSDMLPPLSLTLR